MANNTGYQVLTAGCCALDAAIAVQRVLTLVEPQCSGINVGAFLLHVTSSQVEAFNGWETANAAADQNLFLTAEA